MIVEDGRRRAINMMMIVENIKVVGVVVETMIGTAGIIKTEIDTNTDLHLNGLIMLTIRSIIN